MRKALPLLIIAIVAVSALTGAPRAAADGDPASDILVTQTLFMPWDANISAAAQLRLEGTIAAANRAGFPIRVALIAAPSDLGTITQLWRRPKAYGHFLGTELSELYDGQLLVVMPNGYGLYGPGSGAHTISRAEAAITAPTPGSGDQMAQAATVAVQRLAQTAGIGVSSSVNEIQGQSGTGGDDWVTWLVLALGALAILGAWGASLKARPPNWRRRAQA